MKLKMNRNLFLMELKKNAANLVIWMVLIVFLVSATMAVYPVFLENQSKIMAMMDIIPKAALQFKGISNFADLLSVVGFYAANNVIYMMVLGSIFSVVLSSNIILKEEYQKTAEFLFTWPLTRDEIFLTKLAVVILNIILLNLATTAAGYLAIIIVSTGPVNVAAFLILSVYTFMLNLFFGGLGLFLSTFVRKPKPITTLGIGIVLILYFIDTISKITSGISKIGYISPFRYAATDAVMTGYKLEPLNVMFFVMFLLIFLAVAWSKFRRKDIYL